MANEMTDQQLVDTLGQTERDLVARRFKHSTNQLENTSELRTLRRQIAKLKTEARKREIAQGLPKNGLLNSLRPAAAATSGGSTSSPGGFLQGIVDKATSDE